MRVRLARVQSVLPFAGVAAPGERGSACRPSSESTEFIIDAGANQVDVIGANTGTHGGNVEILSLRRPVRGKSPLGARADRQPRPPMRFSATRHDAQSAAGHAGECGPTG